MDQRLVDELLCLFPNSHFVGVLSEFQGGRSDAPVLAVRYRSTGRSGLSGTKVIKIGPETWAEHEQSFYSHSSVDALSPLLAQFEMRSKTIKGMTGVAYSLAFDSVNEPQSLAHVLDGGIANEAELLTQIRHVAKSLTDWYLNEDIATNSHVESTFDLLCRMLGKNRIRDTSERLHRYFPFGDQDALHLQVDGLKSRLPNPIRYLDRDEWASIRFRPNCPIGHIHGDLNSNNIICLIGSKYSPKIIDFAQSSAEGVPFFDLAYLEFDIVRHLMPVQHVSARSQFLSLLDFSMASTLPHGCPHGWQSEQVWRLVLPIRQQVQRLLAVDKESFTVSWWLSTIAVGLNFARKGLGEIPWRERASGVIFAAYGLERLSEIMRVQGLGQERRLFIPWIQENPEAPSIYPMTRGKYLLDVADERNANTQSRLSAGTVGSGTGSLRRDFYGHVSVVPNYVARPEVLSKIRSEFLNSTSPLALTSSVPSKATALHGMGGIGKSVVARALCEDLAVQSLFPDGILWATIGKEPDRISRLREWITRLGGAVTEILPTEDSLKDLLAHLLRDRACLLILDDVWRRRDIDLFRVGGPKCRLLLTTRDAEIARGIGAKIEPIPLMSALEAIELLETWADGHLATTPEATKKAIVKRLGYLPLAIKLAGAQLQRKDPVRWLRDFNALVLRSQRIEDVHDSLELTFALSLEELSEYDLNLYSALAILKEDEITPQIGVIQLWQGLCNLGSDRAEDLVNDLSSRALLDLIPQGETKGILIHDLVHDLLHARLDETELKMAHQAMIRGYDRAREDRAWHTLHDDGYLYDHLVYHLDAGQLHEPIMNLFADNGWMSVRVMQREDTYDAYFDDIEVAWRIAHAKALTQIKMQQEATALTDCVRIALIRSGVCSMANAYDPRLVAQLVQVGKWKSARALSIAAKMTDPERRAATYASILGTDRLNPVQRNQAEEGAIEAIRSVKDTGVRGDLLVGVAPLLTGLRLEHAVNDAQLLARNSVPQPLVEIASIAPANLAVDVLDSIISDLDKEQLAEALVGLVPNLPETTLERVLELTLAMRHSKRTAVLVALAPRLSLQLQTQALAAGEEWGGTALQEVLIALAPYLPIPLHQRALRAASKLPAEGMRVQALLALAPYLLPSLEKPVMDVAFTLRDEEWRIRALVGLVPNLPETTLERVLELTLAMRHSKRTAVLVALAPRLSLQLQTQALAAGEEWGGTALQEVLIALAPYLPIPLHQRALRAASKLPAEGMRVQALLALAPYLLPSLEKPVMDVAFTLRDEEWRIRALVGLVPHLKAQERSQVVAQVLRALAFTPQEEEKISLDLAEYSEVRSDLLDEHLDDEYSAYLADINDDAEDETSSRDWIRAYSLKELAAYVPHQLEARALKIASEIGMDRLQVEVLMSMVPHFSPRRTEPIVRRALDLVRNGEDLENSNEWALDTLCAMALHVPMALAQKFLQASSYIEDELYQARVICAFAPHLPNSLLEQVLQIVSSLVDSEAQLDIFYAIAPRLSESLLEQVVEIVWGLDDDLTRTDSIVTLIPYLKDPLLHSVINRSITLIDHDWITRALSNIAPQLSDNTFAHISSVIQGIADIDWHTELLIQLLPHMSHEMQMRAMEHHSRVASSEAHAALILSSLSSLTEEAMLQSIMICHAPGLLSKVLSARGQALSLYGLEVARRIIEGEPDIEKTERTKALAALAPYLPDKERFQAMESVLKTVLSYPSQYGEALVLLAPHLPEQLLDQAVVAIMKVRSTDMVEVKALATLALHTSGKRQVQILSRVLNSIQATLSGFYIPQDDDIVDTLATLVPHLPKVFLDRCLKMVKMMRDEDSRIELLQAFAPYLDEFQLEQGLEIAIGIREIKSRIQAMVALAPYISPRLVGRMMGIVNAIGYQTERTKALAALAPYLPDKERFQAMESVLKTVLSYPSQYGEALVLLAPHLPEQLLDQALTIAKQWQEGPGELARDILIALATRLPQPLLSEAVDMGGLIEDEHTRTEVLLGLINHAPDNLLPRILDLVHHLDSGELRIQLLSAIIATSSSNATTLTSLRLEIVETLAEARLHSQEGVLAILSLPSVARAPVVSGEIVNSFALNICGICCEWQWIW